MNSRLAGLSIAATLALLSPCAAQKEVNPKPVVEGDPVLLNDISPRMEAAQERHRETERAEDMAILSQILYEDLLQLYLQDLHAAGTTARSALNANREYDQFVQQLLLGERYSVDEVRRPLAEHLPGYGVVIQIQAPPPQPLAAEASPEADPEKLSRWEATRRRMRGEAVDDGTTCAACHQTGARTNVNQLWWNYLDRGEDPHHGLAISGAARRLPTRERVIEALIDVLAEAGGRLRHIQPDERITLTVQYVTDSQQPLDDEKFLRHVYLDLVGELPTTEEIKSFLADRSPEKRSKIIDELAERSGPSDEKNRRSKKRPDRAEAAAPESEAAAPTDANAVAQAIDDLIHHRWRRMKLETSSEMPLPGRISVTATRRQIDALAAGAMQRSEFGKQAVVRIIDPAESDQEPSRSR